MDNYKFCVRWVLDKEHVDACRVLDYGCGSGQAVEQLTEKTVKHSGV
jgi:hypothetical protein